MRPSHLLSRPSAQSRVVHSVYFYESDAALMQRLCAIIESAIGAGNSALMVVTAAHCDGLLKELAKRRVDVRKAESSGRLVIFDAQLTLDTFMVNGHPDRELFLKSVGRLIDDAKARAGSEKHGLSVFGEMVALLWEQGNRQGALELETLWNEVLNDRPFYLHCAYPRQIFTPGCEVEDLKSICACHSHVLGTPAPHAA